MANSTHLDVLKSGVAEWNEWRKSMWGKGQPDLSQATLDRMDLRGINLRIANLRNATLTNVQLEDADCVAANLVGADLSGARISYCRFRNADLRNACLDRSQGTRTDFSGADLRGASLRAANLVGTLLVHAKISDTDLSNSTWAMVVFEGDLSQAVGLESVRHLGPSVFGVATSEYTARGIANSTHRMRAVEHFFRSAGGTDEHISLLRSQIGRPLEFYSCFISYSHADADFALRLCEHLAAAGIRCWLDEHQLLPGDDLYDIIDRGIRLWDKTLLCCSRYSLNSWWVEQEIEKALAKERVLSAERQEKVRCLIPLDLDGYVFHGWQSGKATLIRSRVVADFVDWRTDEREFQSQMARLRKSLQMASAAGGR